MLPGASGKKVVASCHCLIGSKGIDQRPSSPDLPGVRSLRLQGDRFPGSAHLEGKILPFLDLTVHLQDQGVSSQGDLLLLIIIIRIGGNKLCPLLIPQKQYHIIPYGSAAPKGFAPVRAFLSQIKLCRGHLPMVYEFRLLSLSVGNGDRKVPHPVLQQKSLTGLPHADVIGLCFFVGRQGYGSLKLIHTILVSIPQVKIVTIVYPGSHPIGSIGISAVAFLQSPALRIHPIQIPGQVVAALCRALADNVGSLFRQLNPKGLPFSSRNQGKWFFLPNSHRLLVPKGTAYGKLCALGRNVSSCLGIPDQL